MRLWKLESFGLKIPSPSGVVFIAHREGESRPALYKRAKAALGLAGKRYMAQSDHTRLFYIGRRGAPADARGWLLDDVKEPGGAEWMEWLRNKFGGAQWCVTPRLGSRLLERGYTVAVTQRRFNDLKAEYLTQKGIPK